MHTTFYVYMWHYNNYNNYNNYDNYNNYNEALGYTSVSYVSHTHI